MCLNIDRGQTADLVMSLLDENGNLTQEKIPGYKVIIVNPARCSCYIGRPVPSCGELYISSRKHRQILPHEKYSIVAGIHVYLDFQDARRFLDRLNKFTIPGELKRFALIKCYCKIEDLVAAGDFFVTIRKSVPSAVFTKVEIGEDVVPF